jgi:hypothetical protein
MGLNDMLDDGQAKTGTAQFAAPGPIAAIKSLKQPGQMLLR